MYCVKRYNYLKIKTVGDGMKTASKVFIWIGMIAQFYLIYPIIVGILALRKIDEAVDRNELQTFGLITLFFCSLLGGVFMLCIKDEELGEVKNSLIISKEVEEVENIEEGKSCRKNNFVPIFSSICIIGIPVLLLVSFVFAIIPMTLFEGATESIFCLVLFQLIFSVICLFNYLKNDKKVKKLTIVLYSIFVAYSVLTIVFSILSYTTFVYRVIEMYLVADLVWHCVAWQYWIVFGIACATTPMSLIFVMVNTIKRKTKSKKKTSTKKVVVRSRLEIELNEIKRLYETGVITEDEYNSMRSSIINKYCK